MFSVTMCPINTLLLMIKTSSGWTKPLNWKLKQKAIFTKKYIQNGKFESDFVLLETLITEINLLVSTTKALYYKNLGKKLNNHLLNAKTYWSILKTFYNGKKTPLIPPLLVDDKFVTDMKTKANISNNFFAEQCTPLKSDSIYLIKFF